MDIKKYLKYIPNVIVAFILLQTLAFKFTGHEQSVALFEQLNLLGMDESIGRIGSGIVELIIGVGILIPKFARKAALGAIVLMAGAIFFHITTLGFEGDNLPLSIMAIVAFVLSIFIWKKQKPAAKITVVEAL